MNLSERHLELQNVKNQYFLIKIFYTQEFKIKDANNQY